LKTSIFKPLCYQNHANSSITTCQTYVDLPKKILWKSAIFHSIKPPLDAEVAEKFLNGI